MKIINLAKEPVETYAHLRCVVLPSGIGEFQWAWTKFENAGERFAVFALDGAPRRLHQFVELHPKIDVFGWVGYDYSQIREFQKFHELTTWERVRALFGPGQVAFLACNPHLEAGKPLRDWMPDLETTYSYPIQLKDQHIAEARRVLHDRNSNDLLIGISCASYRGAAAWKTWEVEQWRKFLGLIVRDFPHAKFVLLGGSWDDLTSSLYDPDGPFRWQLDARGLPPVGTTTFGGVTALLSQLDGYIGFSSGLGHVAAHLCGTPVFMLWPEHEYEFLSRSWVNPELLDNGSYVPSRWLEPEVVYKSTKLWLDQIEEKR